MTTLRRSPLKNPFTGEGAAWRIAGAAMLAVTLAGQHPIELFSRFRSKDTLSLVPNWKFFAPNPCMHDSHFLYRTVDADGDASPWQDSFAAETRKPQHIVWFPTRRADKSVFDACSDILPILEFGGFAAASQVPGYRLITEHLRVLIRSRGPVGEVRGFQFALAHATGYDTRHRPNLVFVSPFIPLDPQAPGTPLTRSPAKTLTKV
ncbi:hypothetical protein E4N62_06260 [Streptomyces sp. MNU76]|uniref:hypothetical protein n=1 Tax=Streptomyces sp. MNU76 TaxID=2560026 RepID=UPI001E5EB823|nr:hypothetical protein [Streptomyces sp. MNU76]MCC9704892.1 hypothetical protein [Streptomyces sp. MNU76]